MKIVEGEQAAYDEYVENNGSTMDSYGGAVIWFSERWADLMEPRIEAGEKIEDIAKECEDKSHQEMGKYGLTGFQFGCAVSGLGKFWVHGDALRRWHNLKTQIGNEGEKANESGGTLNPALLGFGG